MHSAPAARHFFTSNIQHVLCPLTVASAFSVYSGCIALLLCTQVDNKDYIQRESEKGDTILLSVQIIIFYWHTVRNLQ